MNGIDMRVQRYYIDHIDYQNRRKTPGFNYGECQRYSLFQQCRIYVMSLLHSSVISFCRVPGFRAEP